MVLSQLRPAHVRWLWYVLICVSLGACSPSYHFRYQYTMVAPDGGNEGFENERVRVRVTPTAEAGVLQLMVLNKSAQPITIVRTQTRYVDPLGQVHTAIVSGAAGLFGSPAWPS